MGFLGGKEGQRWESYATGCRVIKNYIHCSHTEDIFTCVGNSSFPLAPNREIIGSQGCHLSKEPPHFRRLQNPVSLNLNNADRKAR
jgi:hypothetical protein